MPKKNSTAEPLEQRMRRSVSIQDANNGFVVSTFDDKGEKIFIAKTKQEANRIASRLVSGAMK